MNQEGFTAEDDKAFMESANKIIDGAALLEEEEKINSSSTSVLPADCPSVEFTVIHNRDKHTISMPILATIGHLKSKLSSMIGVPPTMQKIMIKGLAKDEQTLESLNVCSSTKIMVVGNKPKDILAVTITEDEVWKKLLFSFNKNIGMCRSIWQVRFTNCVY